MNLILRHAGHARVPLSHQVDVLIHAVRLDLVKDDRMHILAAREHLAERRLDLGVHLPAFLGAVDQVGQWAGLALGLSPLSLRRNSFSSTQ